MKKITHPFNSVGNTLSLFKLCTLFVTWMLLDSALLLILVIPFFGRFKQFNTWCLLSSTVLIHCNQVMSNLLFRKLQKLTIYVFQNQVFIFPVRVMTLYLLCNFQHLKKCIYTRALCSILYFFGRQTKSAASSDHVYCWLFCTALH